MDIASQIKQEKETHEELDAKLKEWRKKIKDQHKNMGGVNMSRAHVMQTQKKVTKLENTLQLVCNYITFGATHIDTLISIDACQ